MLFQNIKGNLDAQICPWIARDSLTAVAIDIWIDPSATDDFARGLVDKANIEDVGDVLQTGSQKLSNGQLETPSIGHGKGVLDETLSKGFGSHYSEAPAIVLESRREKFRR